MRISDWSSDVCSSDLRQGHPLQPDSSLRSLPMKLDSSTAAVVTGGASGLGRATAEALAAAGVKVAIFDINDALGEEVAQSIGGLFVHVDITDEQSRSEEHTSELQSLMRLSYAVFCLKKK